MRASNKSPYLKFVCTTICLAFLLVVGTTVFGQGIHVPASELEIMEWKGGEVVKDEALVQFKKSASFAEQAAVHERHNCRVIETVADGLFRVQLNGAPLQSVLDAYNDESIIDYAEPHTIYRHFFTPNDSSWNQQWGPKNMKCPEAWDIYKGDPNTIVAILDSSVDHGHSDLSGNYKYGYDYANGDSDPYDFLDFIGHGTHCSGIAAAVTNNSNGIAGVGFNCEFAFYQVGTILFITDAAVVQAVNDTVAKGWHVISMSFGGPSPTQSIQNALNNAYNAGVVCIAAAGNDGNTAMQYPAGYTNVMAVASHNSSNQRSSFSTYGTWVDVSAPGEGIYSTIYEFWGGYTNMDGTSMACPGVAGMANILYSLIGGARTKANADLIRNTIQDTSVPASWVAHGRVDVEAAMLFLSATNPPTISNVSPAQVQAFMGGTITLTGTEFTSATSVSAGGTVLYPPDFTIVNDTTITFDAPPAQALGQAAVTVTNPAGTSAPGYYTYVETDPPKIDVASMVGAQQPLTWNYGGGSDDYYILLLSTDSTTAPYKGFDVLLNYIIVYSAQLDANGLGSLPIIVPNGLGGTTFYSQIGTFEPPFVGASNIPSTYIIN